MILNHLKMTDNLADFHKNVIHNDCIKLVQSMIRQSAVPLNRTLVIASILQRSMKALIIGILDLNCCIHNQ